MFNIQIIRQTMRSGFMKLLTVEEINSGKDQRCRAPTPMYA